MTVRIDAQQLFRARTPPPGGWERVRQRLHHHHPPSAPRLLWSAALVPLLVLITVTLWPASRLPPLELHGVTPNPPGPSMFVVQNGKRQLLPGHAIHGMQVYELDAFIKAAPDSLGPP